MKGLSCPPGAAKRRKMNYCFRRLIVRILYEKPLAVIFQRKDEVFRELEQQFPYLAEHGSTEPGFETANFTGEDYRDLFPDKQISESGLSKPAFWQSMIPDMLLSGDVDNINKKK